MQAMVFERDQIGPVRIHVMPTQRFKTFAVSVYMGVPLREETVTSTALLPFVLRRGTERFPLTKQFREKLDDLFGAGFGFDIYKRGDYQMIQFRMDTINDRFVRSDVSLLKESLQFLGEAITSPSLAGGVFQSKYVKEEKETLTRKIEAIVNDKIRYAAERCLEEMCKEEPYRLRPLGRLSDVAAISADNLYERYMAWLAECTIDVYIVGDTDMEQVKACICESFRFPGNARPGYQIQNVHKPVDEVKKVTDRLDVSQGKLNMGLRANVTYADDDYAAMLMYNGILGAYPHSKLFRNVREKESLAYYASSRYDGHKGLLTIQSGIEFDHEERAIQIIRQQLDAMKAGDISDLELSQTKAMIAGQLKEMRDSAFEIIGFDVNAVLSGKVRQADELIREIEEQNRDSIERVAANVQLDTIYFLRDRKGEPAHAHQNL